MGLLTNLGGGKDGRFFAFNADHIQPKAKPGFSPLPEPSIGRFLRDAASLRHVFASPNLPWVLVALAVYFLAPYDLSPGGVAARAPLSWAFFAQRFPLWFCITTAYVAFFEVTLYGLGWAKRPFIAGRRYNWAKLAHNAFWSTSGIAIWTCFENVWAHLWAAGKLSYMPDAVAFSTAWGFAKFVLALVIVPLEREVHFYFAHRLLHWAPLYRLVHSLHHRVQDIECFAGLSMHPVEHLYYFACCFPSLVPHASPFLFLWNGVHLLLSPAASHSGWEDHMQGDQFHYMHHRYFEANYAGGGAGALDKLFGTYVGSFADKEPEKRDTGLTEQPADAKASLGLPSFEFAAYLALATATVAAWAWAACHPGAVEKALPFVPPHALHVALGLLAGFGPVAATLPWAGRHVGGWKLERRSAPGLHLTLGSAVCAAPVALAAYLAF